MVVQTKVKKYYLIKLFFFRRKILHSLFDRADSASKNAPSGELKVKQVEVGLADLSLLGKQTISQLGMSGKKALDELKFASSETSSSSTPSEKDPITTRVPPLPPGRKKRVKKFFLFKFFDFVQQYPKILEKRFPGAMNVYRVFMVGVKVSS